MKSIPNLKQFDEQWKDGRSVQFAALMDFCNLQHSKLAKHLQTYKERVVHVSGRSGAMSICLWSIGIPQGSTSNLCQCTLACLPNAEPKLEATSWRAGHSRPCQLARLGYNARLSLRYSPHSTFRKKGQSISLCDKVLRDPPDAVQVKRGRCVVCW